MKAWIKGGLIGFTLAGLSVIFVFIGSPLEGIGDIMITPIYIMLVLVGILQFITDGNISGTPKIILYVSHFIFYILIGALIGWIVGKTKSERQASDSSIK